MGAGWLELLRNLHERLANRGQWYGFPLATGDVARGPATFPLARFETRVSGDVIEVRSAHAR